MAVHHADQREGRSKFLFYLRYERSRLRYVWRNFPLRTLPAWLLAEWRWYRKHFWNAKKHPKGTEHHQALRAAYRQMWWKAPWIVLTRWR